MENVEITVKVNGKEVDLSTISTETFENVKEASKPKEVPVVRIGTMNRQDDRIIIRVDMANGCRCDNDILALDTITGQECNSWNCENDGSALNIKLYSDVYTL